MLRNCRNVFTRIRIYGAVITWIIIPSSSRCIRPIVVPVFDLYDLSLYLYSIRPIVVPVFVVQNEKGEMSRVLDASAMESNLISYTLIPFIWCSIFRFILPKCVDLHFPTVMAAISVTSLLTSVENVE